MPRRASSLINVSNLAVSREIDSKYDVVKAVAEKLPDLETFIDTDIDALIASLNEAVDFTGITVEAGSIANWDPITKKLTVPTLQGEKGVDLTLDTVEHIGNGVFRWVFSDNTTFVTPNLTGNAGAKGETGTSVHHTKGTGTTDPEGDFSSQGKKDTYTMYGDADENIVLGWFTVQNGAGPYEYVQESGYTGTEAEFYLELADLTNTATRAQLAQWRAEANEMTTDSFANEAEDVEVRIHTSNNDGTFSSVVQVGEYSALHYQIKTRVDYELTVALGKGYVVADNAKKDALTTLTTADTVFVSDDGDGKWARYQVTAVTDGLGSTSTFEVIMDEDTYLNANTAPDIKAVYESNANTNAFTDVAKQSILNNAQAIANLATAQSQISNDDVTVITTTNQVLSFAIDTDSTNESVFTVDAAADTITFLKDASYNFTSAVTFVSATNLGRTVTFDLINVATGLPIVSEVAILNIGNWDTETATMITLLTIGKNGMPAAPCTMRIEVRADDVGYTIPAFNSVLASSSSYDVTSAANGISVVPVGEISSTNVQAAIQELDTEKEPKNANIQSHISATDNPHEVTQAQVGLGNVDNTSDTNKPLSTATSTALNSKVDKVTGKELSDNNYTDAEVSKLNGIESGATADQTKADIDGLGINAATVNSKTVLTSVPAEAVFTDTVYTLPASVVHDTEKSALHSTDALRSSGSTISLYKGDGTYESVTVPNDNTVYTHPTYAGDDINVDTGALTGATVVSDIDFNITTDTQGHVTDANGVVSTRTLTLANLGYTGATNANYFTYSHPSTHPATIITTTDEFAYSNSTNVQDVLDDLDQAIANVNAKDPVVTLTGAVTGSGTMTDLGNVSITTTATSDPTLTLTGDVTGSATFTNLGNATLTAVVANNSHTHDQTTVSNSADSDKLNGKTNTTASTGSTIVERDSSGDISARLFRSEYDSTNSSCNYFMTQVDTGTNNYLRPSTKAQVATALSGQTMNINGSSASCTGNATTATALTSGDKTIAGALTVSHIDTENGGFVSNCFGGISTIATSTNVDHMWHDDTNNAWNFCSDTTYKGVGNSDVVVKGVKATGINTQVYTVNPGDSPNYANTIDYNVSGTTALTTDRNACALNIDMDDSYSGGDTDNEHRAYGIIVNNNCSGDADNVYGIQSTAIATLSSGTTTIVKGLYGVGIADNAAGATVNTVSGVTGFAYTDNAGGSASLLMGGEFKAYSQGDASGNVAEARGVFAEVEWNSDAGTLTNAFAVQAHIDQNEETAQITNGYLFYGSYAGSATNSYGVYIATDVPNYFAGDVTATAFSGNGSALTSLNASNISSGTISDTYLPATISSNITGSSASCTGNATTATTLQTARTINGVSFNGTANITVYDSTKAPLASPTFTGIPAAPTATLGTNTAQVATTAFVLANSLGDTTGVLSATAGASANAVGTYMLCSEHGLNRTSRQLGTTVAGSLLRPASLSGGVVSVSTVQIYDDNWRQPGSDDHAVLSGTWRIMGAYPDDSSVCDYPLALWLRIS